MFEHANGPVSANIHSGAACLPPAVVEWQTGRCTDLLWRNRAAADLVRVGQRLFQENLDLSQLAAVATRVEEKLSHQLLRHVGTLFGVPHFGSAVDPGSRSVVP